ncbi:MAG: acyl carrier protein [Pseudomonadota bacterium]
MTKDVGQQIIRIIAEQAMVDEAEITADTALDDLGLDSLAMVEVVFGIEETFDISVPYNANDPTESDFELTTVKAVTEAVAKLVDEKGAE